MTIGRFANSDLTTRAGKLCYKIKMVSQTGQTHTFFYNNISNDIISRLNRTNMYAYCGRRPGKSNWNVLVTYLQKRELLPCAVFSFSKKLCEEAALNLLSVDLTTSHEKSEIHVFTEQVQYTSFFFSFFFLF